MGRKIVQAFQTLGVVFGDVGTSPLYTFGVMFNKSPIHGEEDVLGALSLVLFTLILIPLIKYVLVVLWANDDGEGMQRLLTNSSCLITSGYMHLDVLRIAILDIMADSTIICCLALMYDNNMSTPICYAFVVVQKVRTVLARMLSSLHLHPIICLIASMKQGHINLKISILNNVVLDLDITPNAWQNTNHLFFCNIQTGRNSKCSQCTLALLVLCNES